jgi:hypothetical protein
MNFLQLFDWIMELWNGETCNQWVIRRREKLSRRFQTWGYKDCTWLPPRKEKLPKHLKP